MKTQRAASKAATVKKRNNNKSKAGAAYKVDTFKVPENPTLDDIKHAVGLQELDARVKDAKESCWETESLLEDALAELGDAKLSSDDPDTCSPDEAMVLRHQLRALGPAEFCRRTVDAGSYTAKKLLSAFGIKPPNFLEGAEDEAYFSILSLAISRELSKRAKLWRFNTVDDAVELLNKSQNIIVLTGAGISTSLGIPDFRSKGGLYSQLEHLGLNDPQEVFDISVFKQDPTIFYTVAKDILPSTNRFTPTHAFISMLQKKGKLLTNYTQNIDNLEAKAGISADKMVQCHGSFATATCVQCGFKCVGDDIFPDIKAGKIPRCPRCIQNLRPNGSTKRKRSAGTERKRRRFSSDDSTTDDEYDIPSAGVMKPDITFFGEALPDEFSRRLTEHDRDKVDLVIVIGTSLKVTPVSEIVSWLPGNIPQIYISRQAVSHINFDIDLLGDCDVVVSELCRRAGWPLQHEMVPEDQVVDVRPEGSCVSRHVFEVVRPGTSPVKQEQQSPKNQDQFVKPTKPARPTKSMKPRKST
ncbi:NAD-dependent protein deacetylase hst1 [Colletotrichum siamense]|uniref:NAD-dependent protein deacetylase hst1 n=1 Tax=Colletotrichum siamense TaxID=690259 RepID=A0A9P5BR07_COLSI|nr:NAD-dependent protein deacetylase hst1 [Colletotrichum siamense]KAI8175506.1 NAD-dependent protein deacetylase hst1 [Colletotrichum sp. SAR 10_65]KAI8178343.1 NAD-dependent protein deacetylase hst1 [Colletotrichum sp. SAR 10_75]KAI8204974.1 NAD-dependent protein deacetylase hst1 [Colletotrichum sp. SAR 10_76]KAI8234171.1 NAD-dependent protein deacetylase hst1 [Colletotrichum sp. SAR 10_86]KAI8254566.1 NAD-dependent protein deacetylase hst1 [Colletotrichum sp. SAR 10_77]KAI8265245.1 NAD-dep